MKAFIVWNEDKTEGFVTIDKGLSYEVRKSASTNCVTANGTPSPVGVAFCKQWWMDNCTVEEIETEDHIASHEEAKELKDRRVTERRAAANGYAEDELNLGEDEEELDEDDTPLTPEEQERSEKPLPAYWGQKPVGPVLTDDEASVIVQSHIDAMAKIPVPETYGLSSEKTTVSRKPAMTKDNKKRIEKSSFPGYPYLLIVEDIMGNIQNYRQLISTIDNVMKENNRDIMCGGLAGYIVCHCKLEEDRTVLKEKLADVGLPSANFEDYGTSYVR
jgi:hypothetical protein